jgi:uncharacterized phiE125 gp8 family phage protein
MDLVRVTAPAEPVVTLAEAREALDIDTEGSPPVSEHDDLIEKAVAAATAELDGPEGWLGRALVTQTWKLLLPRFPGSSGSSAGIPLPLTTGKALTSPPATVVSAITYSDTDGVVQTLDAAAYRVLSEAEPNVVEPIYNTAWPASRATRHTLAITYTAGFGAASEVPEDIKTYIKARVRQFYDNPSLLTVGVSVSETPFYRNSL